MSIIYFNRQSCDREDFIEDKIQLEQALLSGLSIRRGGNSVQDNEIAIGHGVKDSALKNALWPRLEQIEKAHNYHKTTFFKGFSKRDYRICAFTIEAIEKACREIGVSCIVKYMTTAKATGMCKVMKGQDIDSQLIDFYQYEFARLGGEDRECLVQSLIPMHYEYRIFVVNGKPVTGAGCIEENTPLENENIFDFKLEDTRGKNPVELPDVASAYEDFALNIAAPALAKEGVKDYVLDLFMDKDSNIGVIELNPIHRSGFYAINYPLLFNEILQVSQAIYKKERRGFKL